MHAELGALQPTTTLAQSRSALTLYVSAVILAGALFYVRALAPSLAPDLPIEDHPVIRLCTALVLAGAAWFFLFNYIRRFTIKTTYIFPAMLLIGLVFRVMFFDSQPIYENDYKRYLWDGAVTASGENPYIYSPEQIYEASFPGAESPPALATLAVMSNTADGLTGEINSSALTTIYPPAAQGVFVLAHWIAPFKPWGLQLVFLLIESLGMLALLAGLKARGLPRLWSAIYWLNPLIILTSYNGIHMDVLLVAPLLAALLFVSRRPLLAGIMLSVAAAIKIWPLLLAPVLFRKWRSQPATYIPVAIMIAVLTALSLLPMLFALKPQAGLAAYSANWTNSSFIFPGLRDAIGLFTEYSDRLARYVIAASLIGFSLWLGFVKRACEKTLPAHLMILAGAFIFLSPTGYPWYFIWFLMFLPFAAQHWSARGLAALTIGAAAYYARYKLGDLGHHAVYTRVLLPLEFGLPLLILAYDGWKAKRHALS